jgi:hypothetical protein
MDTLPSAVVPPELVKEINDALYLVLQTRANLQAKLISQELQNGDNLDHIRGGLEEIENILFQVNKGFKQIGSYIETRAAQVSYVWQPKQG